MSAHHCRVVQFPFQHNGISASTGVDVSDKLLHLHDAQCRKMLTTCTEHITVPSQITDTLEADVRCSSVHTIRSCHYTMYEQHRKMSTKYIMLSLFHRKVICGKEWLKMRNSSRLLGQSFHLPFHSSTQYSRWLVVCLCSTKQETTQSNLQHSHCRYNQNSSQYKINKYEQLNFSWLWKSQTDWSACTGWGLTTVC
jgi:hypothetical protein